ncbi:hypothetical protein LCGC14_0848080 [marine sediment metagenome]|uniref:Uncharacterized protein n=1 Tax=marine sediment metagenome TaxID=412755 RepID=A0A0F9PWF3_9ZZZZ
MAEDNQDRKRLVDMRLSAHVRGVNAKDVLEIVELVEDLLSGWGEVEVSHSVTRKRRRLTMADALKSTE